ncbi:MAG: DUF3892 domain-containing protein [Dehalococcoidia bacterium]|jgi:hypothetical protein
MAQRLRIRCINKTDRYNPHERITHVGGLNADRTRWRLTQADAIKGIEDGKWSFYVEQPEGHEVDVVVAVSASAQGHKYLKTKADGEQPDNLLALPECPSA